MMTQAVPIAIMVYVNNRKMIREKGNQQSIDTTPI